MTKGVVCPIGLPGQFVPRLVMVKGIESEDGKVDTLYVLHSGG
jgi:hypothetical protein